MIKWSKAKDINAFTYNYMSQCAQRAPRSETAKNIEKYLMESPLIFI